MTFIARLFSLAIGSLILAMTVNGVSRVDGEEIKDTLRQSESYLGEAEEDILPYLAPVNIRVGKDVIVLKSGRKFVITNGQPVLFWRPKGQADWIESKGGKFEALEKSPSRLSFHVAFGKLHANITIEKMIGDRIWRFSGTLTNNSNNPVELARFHYFTANVPSDINFLELAGPREQPQLRSGQASVAIRADIEQFWKEMGVDWPRLSEPIHDQPGWFVSSDVAALIDKWNTPGWGFGFIGPGEAFGEIGYRGLPNDPEVFLAVLLDNIVLDPKETRILENAIVCCGDWQASLDAWVRICAAKCNVKIPMTPLVGYCSWYQKARSVTSDDIERATREFAKWPLPPGGRTIQIDDGFQIQPGDWKPNERFELVWPGLAKRIEATGSIPGLWLAPTTVHKSHPIVKQHPDWLQRLPSGEPAIYFSNWGRTYYLDPDHPQVREYIRSLLKHFCAEGWKYFKLDFTYPITAARASNNRKKTEFQTLRDLYVLFREAVGSDVHINACVNFPFRYAIGLVETARLGADIDYNYYSMRKAVQQSLTRTATNGVWLYGDPDCFAMRSENSNLSDEEKRILTGTIGLFGGAFLTSDFASQWTPEEAAFVRRFWNKQGPQLSKSQYVIWSPEGDVVAYRVSYGDGRLPAHRIAFYNWSNAARTIQVRLADAHLDSTVILRLDDNDIESEVTLNEGIISISDQPAHSIRIVDLLDNK